MSPRSSLHTFPIRVHLPLSPQFFSMQGATKYLYQLWFSSMFRLLSPTHIESFPFFGLTFGPKYFKILPTPLLTPFYCSDYRKTLPNVFYTNSHQFLHLTIPSSIHFKLVSHPCHTTEVVHSLPEPMTLSQFLWPLGTLFFLQDLLKNLLRFILSCTPINHSNLFSLSVSPL